MNKQRMLQCIPKSMDLSGWQWLHVLAGSSCPWFLPLVLWQEIAGCLLFGNYEKKKMTTSLNPYMCTTEHPCQKFSLWKNQSSPEPSYCLRWFWNSAYHFPYWNTETLFTWRILQLSRHISKPRPMAVIIVSQEVSTNRVKTVRLQSRTRGLEARACLLLFL